MVVLQSPAVACGFQADRDLYCYTELAVSSVAMVETIDSAHCVYPRRDGQAKSAWVAGLNTEMVCLPEDGQPTGYQPRRTSSLIEINALKGCSTVQKIGRAAQADFLAKLVELSYEYLCRERAICMT